MHGSIGHCSGYAVPSLCGPVMGREELGDSCLNLQAALKTWAGATRLEKNMIKLAETELTELFIDWI